MSRVLFGIVIALLCIFILAPTVVIAISSFGGSEILEFPPHSWTLKWFGTALARQDFQSAAWNSFWLAGLTTIIATPLSLAAATGIVRGNLPGKVALQTFLLAPLIVPAIVISLAILVSLSNLGIRLTEARLVAAHVLITLPYLLRTVSAGLSRLDPLAEEAARTLGANSFRTFWYVTLPALKPSIIAGMIFAFIISFDNVSISLFLASARTNTLPLTMLSYVEFNFDPSVAAVSTLLIVMALTAAIVLERSAGLRRTLGG